MKLFIINSLFFLFLIALNSCSIDLNNPDSIMNKIRTEYQNQVDDLQYYRNACYREKAKVANHYVAYSEGYGHLISLGYNFKIPVDNFSLLLDNIRKADSKKSWKKYVANYHKNSEVPNDSISYPEYNALLSSYRWFEINGPLSDKNKGKYDYKLINSNKDLNKKVIYFSPKDTLQKYLYHGAITFNMETYQIEHITFDGYRLYSEPFREWVTSVLTIDFININKKLYFSKLDAFYTKKDLEHWISICAIDTSVNKTVLTEDECVSLNVNDSNPMVLYDESEWENHSINFDKDFEDIKKDLELVNLSLTDQFIRNSGKNFFNMTELGKTNKVNYKSLESLRFKFK
ncbi:MAG: hypothetical protein Q8T08_07280 [Ignavibacteria bacterium]|nr:hypothetical protein [Ignavibacteria bacterium]